MLWSRSCTLTCTCSLFMNCSFGVCGLAGGGRARRHHAAVLREVGDEPGHVLEIRSVDNEATVLAAAPEARPRQTGEMERKRRRRDVELLADRTGSPDLRR